jgi:hypothetical protein
MPVAAAKDAGSEVRWPEARSGAEGGHATIEATAGTHAANVLPLIREIKRAGASTLREIPDALNARGVATARGGRW